MVAEVSGMSVPERTPTIFAWVLGRKKDMASESRYDPEHRCVPPLSAPQKLEMVNPFPIVYVVTFSLVESYKQFPGFASRPEVTL